MKTFLKISLAFVVLLVSAYVATDPVAHIEYFAGRAHEIVAGGAASLAIVPLAALSTPARCKKGSIYKVFYARKSDFTAIPAADATPTVLADIVMLTGVFTPVATKGWYDAKAAVESGLFTSEIVGNERQMYSKINAAWSYNDITDEVLGTLNTFTCADDVIVALQERADTERYVILGIDEPLNWVGSMVESGATRADEKRVAFKCETFSERVLYTFEGTLPLA